MDGTAKCRASRLDWKWPAAETASELGIWLQIPNLHPQTEHLSRSAAAVIFEDINISMAKGVATGGTNAGGFAQAPGVTRAAGARRRARSHYGPYWILAPYEEL
jgi:hypothetical protein